MIVIAVLPTFLFPGFHIACGYVKQSDGLWKARRKTFVGALLAFLLAGFYAAAGVTMIQKPGKDFRKAFDIPPYKTWWIAVGLIWLQWYA